MKPILLVGKICSGKTTAAEYLVETYGYNKLSISQYLKDLFESHYGRKPDKRRPDDRDKLQLLGMKLRQVDPNWHIDELVDGIMSSNNGKFVIDDIRFKNEVSELSESFDTISIKLSCDEENQFERAMLRDKVRLTQAQLGDDSEIECDFIDCNYEIENVYEKEWLFGELDLIVKANS